LREVLVPPGARVISNYMYLVEEVPSIELLLEASAGVQTSAVGGDERGLWGS